MSAHLHNQRNDKIDGLIPKWLTQYSHLLFSLIYEKEWERKSERKISSGAANAICRKK